MSVGRAAKSPLGVVHFLGWITGVSVALAAFYWLRQIVPELPADPAQRLRELSLCLSYGAGLCGACILLSRRFSGCQPEDFCQPGHWMLLILGAAGLLDGLVLLAGSWLKTHSPMFDSGAGMYWIWIAQIASALIVAAVAADVALNRERGAPRSWRQFSLGVAALVAAQATWVFTSWVTYKTWAVPGAIEISAPFISVLGIPLVILLLAVALLDDRRERRMRDWLHYVGAGAIVVYAVTYWANDIWYRWLAG